MGVPNMKLFLATDDRGERSYFKNMTEAKRWCRDRHMFNASYKEVHVELTKDGVLDALNNCPFKRRIPGASARVSEPPPEPLRAPGRGSLIAPAPGVPAPELEIDPEDRELLAGKDPGYIRGWYQVKRKRMFR